MKRDANARLLNVPQESAGLQIQASHAVKPCLTPRRIPASKHLHQTPIITAQSNTFKKNYSKAWLNMETVHISEELPQMN